MYKIGIRIGPLKDAQNEWTYFTNIAIVVCLYGIIVCMEKHQKDADTMTNSKKENINTWDMWFKEQRYAADMFVIQIIQEYRVLNMTSPLLLISPSSIIS